MFFFAVLIDEAHSSTEGVFMQSVTQVLSNSEEEEEKTEEDKMLDEEMIEEGGIQCPNCQTPLEFDFDCDCGCGCDDCEEEEN